LFVEYGTTQALYMLMSLLAKTLVLCKIGYSLSLKFHFT